jgi:hypothetical protein
LIGSVADKKGGDAGPNGDVGNGDGDGGNGGGGGSVTGPVFSQIMSFALRRYGVPPTGTEPSKMPTGW